jgi:zinc transport system permease protein
MTKGVRMNIDDFVLRAVIAGLCIAIAAGPMGCIVLWRRMAYVGDATAHAAILGIALSLTWHIPMFWAVFAVALSVGFFVYLLTARQFSSDAVLGVLSHGALAIGFVILSFAPKIGVDPMSYLFGDILSISWTDIQLIAAVCALCSGLLIWRWQRILTTTLDRDLAYASGINPHVENAVLTLTIALLIAVAIQVVGVLLVSAMLIIPAAAARPLVKTPEMMAIGAVLMGVLSVLGGMQGSLWFDTPTGPSIISCAAIGFAATQIWSAIIGQIRAGG